MVKTLTAIDAMNIKAPSAAAPSPETAKAAQTPGDAGPFSAHMSKAQKSATPAPRHGGEDAKKAPEAAPPTPAQGSAQTQASSGPALPFSVTAAMASDAKSKDKKALQGDYAAAASDPAGALIALMAQSIQGSQGTASAKGAGAIGTSSLGAAEAAVPATAASDTGPAGQAAQGGGFPALPAAGGISSFSQWLEGATGAPGRSAPAVPDAFGGDATLQASIGAAALASGGPTAVPAAAKPSGEVSLGSPDAFASDAAAFAVKASHDGTSQAVLRVTPEALGPMKAEISMSKLPDGTSTLSMTLTLANAAAMDVAKQGLDKLQTALGAAGLPQARIELKFDTPVTASSQGSSMQASTQSGHQGGQQSRWSEKAGAARASAGAIESAAGASPAAGWTPANLFDRSA